MIRSCRAGDVAFESSSAQISWRLPVRALIDHDRRVAVVGPRQVVTGTAPVCAIAAGVSSPGTFSTIGWPGLNPSERL